MKFSGSFESRVACAANGISDAGGGIRATKTLHIDY